MAKREIPRDSKGNLSPTGRRDMSLMRQRDGVIAILCADIHLSANPPKCRRKEPDWFDTMYKAITQIKAVANHYSAPILCAGDVFDHWKAEPQLINFALNHLPEMYAIPGQHDLPLHNIELIQRSAYWTLVLAGKIHNVPYGDSVMIENNIILHGFPYGFPIKALEEKTKKYHVAIAHDYFWMDTHCYTGAPKGNNSTAYKDRVNGYDAVVFGDNHKGFLTDIDDVPIFNCGGLMRRSVDEKEYNPQIGLLCKSGQIIIQKLNILSDVFEEKEELRGVRGKLGRADLENFLYGLDDLQHKHFDFIEAIEYAIKSRQVDNKVKKIILEALEQ